MWRRASRSTESTPFAAATLHVPSTCRRTVCNGPAPQGSPPSYMDQGRLNYGFLRRDRLPPTLARRHGSFSTRISKSSEFSLLCLEATDHFGLSSEGFSAIVFSPCSHSRWLCRERPRETSTRDLVKLLAKSAGNKGQKEPAECSTSRCTWLPPFMARTT